MTLTWNGENELACGVEAGSGGLSAFGKEVVYEMNRLGMLIDVSHLSERAFWDVLSISKAPVMASHSNAKSLCDHKRNLKDEQILAISRMGGVIGLNFYPPFLSNSGVANMEDCIRHIDRILAVGGENCLGLGSDFDGFTEPVTVGLSSSDAYHDLFSELLKRGYPDRVLQKLAYGNFLSLAKKVLQ
jgi:membrane dipeptidase